MNLEDLLDGLQKRAPWRAVGRLILLDSGFEIHRGYVKTITKAVAEPEDTNRNERLLAGLKEHVVAGEKMLRLISIKPAERDVLSAWLDGKRRTSGPLSDVFPGVASEKTIRDNVGGAAQSLGTLNLLSGRAALFTSARSYTDRVEIPKTQLKSGVAEDFEKLIGVKNVYVQTYDAIWMPGRGNFVCIATDFPVGAPLDFAFASQNELLTHLSKALGRSVEISNLWGAVDGLYETKDGGRVVEYGFATDDESLKHHKSRRGSKCLREGTYDKAGAAAVGDDLRPFKIAVEWTIQRNGEQSTRPEILLPGVAALLYKANASLDHAMVRNCLSSRDLHFVVNKLLPHLKLGT